MLVDIRMPGMDGLELTRRIKQNPLTRDIVVVALTACAMKEDERKAIAAGCNGFITKPIDTHALGSCIRGHLDCRQAEPESRSWPVLAALPFSDLDLEGLRRRFFEDGILQSRQLLECVDGMFDASKTGALLHQWVGTAAVLGYPMISEEAQRMAELVGSGRPVMARLREGFTDLAFAFSGHREALNSSLPQWIGDVLSGKEVALVGFALPQGQRLCGALEHARARPGLWESARPPAPGKVLSTSALVFHVRAETMDDWCIRPGPSPFSNIPLILAGGRQDILAVDPSVQARASEFLIDGWEPEEALMRLAFVLSRPARQPRRTGW
jgi:CheY-like chemotaxis protein